MPLGLAPKGLFNTLSYANRQRGDMKNAISIFTAVLLVLFLILCFISRVFAETSIERDLRLLEEIKREVAHEVMESARKKAYDNEVIIEVFENHVCYTNNNIITCYPIH